MSKIALAGRITVAEHATERACLFAFDREILTPEELYCYHKVCAVLERLPGARRSWPRLQTAELQPQTYARHWALFQRAIDAAEDVMARTVLLP